LKLDHAIFTVQHPISLFLWDNFHPEILSGGVK